MNITRAQLALYGVTDRQWLQPGETLAQKVAAAIAGGVTVVQLREKTLTEECFLEEARQMQRLCQAHGVPLIINDNVEIAAAVGAGVHVGQQDMAVREARLRLGPNAIIGASCRSVEAALAAQEAGADYLGVGAVFGTSTKLDARTIGREALSAICQAVTIPVVAIGGVTAQNMPQLKGTGIAGVAVVSALFAAADPQIAAEKMRVKLENEVL